MRKFGILTIAFFLLTGVLYAQEIPLALDEAVEIALRDNRDILFKAEDIKKSKAKIAQSQSGLFPSLDFTGSWAKTRGYYSKNLTQAATQLALKQTLYDGGSTINTIKQGEYDFGVKKALLDKTILEVSRDVKKVFYTLLLAEEFARLNGEILNNTNAHIKVVEARYSNGEASESELLKIKESLVGVQEAYELSLNQVASGENLLKNLLYLDEKTEIKPEGEFVYQPREVAYDEGFLKAMRIRPEIRQYEFQEKSDKKEIEITKAGNRPTIYASGDYYSRSHLSSVAGVSKQWNDYNAVGLVFSWPIFDGWATKAKVDQAIADLKQTRLLREKTIKDIAMEVKDAYLNLKNAIAKIKTAEYNMVVYHDDLLSMKEKKNKAIVSFLDLDDAQLKYDIACFNKKQAVYDYIVSKADFDKAVGSFME